MPKGIFSTYHPAVSMLFFVSVICLAFCSRQPVYVALTLLGASCYYVYLRGIAHMARMLLLIIPVLVFIAVINSLFNTAGVTTIFEWGIVNITIEGCAFGLAAGSMLVSALIWFGCYNELMTEDKFTYLFGRVAPTVSLVVSMVSRWVPRMTARGRNIFDAQEALIGKYDTSKKGLTRRGVRLLAVLAGLGMEDSIQTSDSMRARGYGTSKRTSYAHYSWHARERIVLVVLAALVAANAVFMYTASIDFAYYPRISAITWTWGYPLYLVLLLMPLLLELERPLRKIGSRGSRIELSPAMQALYGQAAPQRQTLEERGAQ